MNAGEPLRVLVVDDSAMFRHFLSKTVESLEGVKLVGTASDGDDAIRKIREGKPDLVTLDLEMPGKDGLATLRAIRAQGLTTRVVMLSALGGESRTVEALCLGAEDFLVKPNGHDSQQKLRDLLASKVLQFKKTSAHRKERMSTASTKSRETGTRSATQMVVIGVSTGGPNALAEMLPVIPRNFPIPIVLVQHMPPLFTRMLAERLNSKCNVTVHEAQEGMPLLPGNLYIAPGDHHLVLAGTALNPVARLHQGPHENGCRPAADVLFRSAAQMYKQGCLAVIMTGMGKDGLEGTRQIVQEQGYALAQDQASCVVWGMPRFVTEQGLAHEIHPLSRLGPRICEIVMKR